MKTINQSVFWLVQASALLVVTVPATGGI